MAEPKFTPFCLLKGDNTVVFKCVSLVDYGLRNVLFSLPHIHFVVYLVFRVGIISVIL